MEQKIIDKTDEQITQILDEGISPNNIEHLYKLCKINHMAKEDKSMNYGTYGEYGRQVYGREGYGREGYGREQYGEYSGYGARRGGRGRYRGDEHMDRMSEEYGRYQESRQRYGAGEEADKSFHYMIKALEDFIMVLHEEAETQQQKQELTQALQKSMR